MESLQRGEIATLPLAEDRAILSSIAGGSQYYSYSVYADSRYDHSSFLHL